MKVKQKATLHQASPTELHQKLEELTAQLVTTRLEIKHGRLTNTNAAKNIRRQIKVIKTIIREKQLANQRQATT